MQDREPAVKLTSIVHRTMTQGSSACDDTAVAGSGPEHSNELQVLRTMCVGDGSGHTATIRRPDSPFAAAIDDMEETALKSVINTGDGSIRRGQTAEERRIIKRLLAKHAYQELSWVDMLSMMLTSAYPVKVIKEVQRANNFIRSNASMVHSICHQTGPAGSMDAGHHNPSDGGEAAVEVVPSAMHALPQQPQPASRQNYSLQRQKLTVKEVAAQAVLFTRAFEKGYVDRLTSTLQQHSARRQDDYKTLSHEAPLDTLPTAERMWAALERQTANNPHRKRLHSAVKIRRLLVSGSRSEITWTSAARAYVIVFLQRVFHWWTPPRLQYIPWHTYILVLVTCVVFAFMSGEYAYWLEHTSALEPLTRRAWQGPEPPTGPQSLWLWLTQTGAAWRMFHPMFLVLWGGTHPAGAHEGYRWLTSIMVHADMLHLISNTFLFVVLATYVERRNGTFRTAVVFWISAISGGFVSHSTMGSRCTVTVGSSGGVFGLLGLFIADLCLHFSSISYPAYRILSLLIYAVMWLISTFREGSASINHVSHIAGLLVGATWGSLYLPSLPSEVMELASPIAVLMVCFGCLAIPTMQGIFNVSTTCSGSQTDSWSRFCNPPWQ